MVRVLLERSQRQLSMASARTDLQRGNRIPLVGGTIILDDSHRLSHLVVAIVRDEPSPKVEN